MQLLDDSTYARDVLHTVLARQDFHGNRQWVDQEDGRIAPPEHPGSHAILRRHPLLLIIRPKCIHHRSSRYPRQPLQQLHQTLEVLLTASAHLAATSEVFEGVYVDFTFKLFNTAWIFIHGSCGFLSSYLFQLSNLIPSPSTLTF